MLSHFSIPAIFDLVDALTFQHFNLQPNNFQLKTILLSIADYKSTKVLNEN